MAEEDYEEEPHGYYVDEDENPTISILSFIATWFIRIGIVIGVIVLLYFLFKGQIGKALLFILGLLVSYGFGYFFMFCLDKILSPRT